MLKTQFSGQTASTEPTPLFATDAEIECAQRLRHRLEERYLGHSDDYLGHSDAPAESLAPQREVH